MVWYELKSFVLIKLVSTRTCSWARVRVGSLENIALFFALKKHCQSNCAFADSALPSPIFWSHIVTYSVRATLDPGCIHVTDCEDLSIEPSKLRLQCPPPPTEAKSRAEAATADTALHGADAGPLSGWWRAPPMPARRCPPTRRA